MSHDRVQPPLSVFQTLPSLFPPPLSPPTNYQTEGSGARLRVNYVWPTHKSRTEYSPVLPDLWSVDIIMTRCHPALAFSINGPDSSFAVETVVPNLLNPILRRQAAVSDNKTSIRSLTGLLQSCRLAWVEKEQIATSIRHSSGIWLRKFAAERIIRSIWTR